VASATHEGIALLFRERPELALELLAGVAEVESFDWKASKIEDSTLPQSAPAHRPDLVSSFFDARGRRLVAVIIEVQRGIDADKGWTWPLYWASVRARLRCRVVLLVVATSERVARWAARATSGTGPNLRFQPVVVGPAQVPRVADADAARRSPELAVLSSLVHGNEPDGAEVAMAAIEAAGSLDAPRAALYHDLVRHGLDAASTAALEALMKYTGYKGYEYQSDFARKYYGQGHTEGVAAGRADALLVLIRARGLAATPEQVARIRACTDAATLDAWLERIVVASSVDDALR
jgi:hypothetical protein